MHELGLIIDVVEIVERVAMENKIVRVEKVVLTIGEGYSAVPQLMKTVYREAIEGTVLEGSKLELEFVDASGACKKCGQLFNPLRSDGVCPGCGGDQYSVLSGKEFEVKEIVVSN